MADNYVQPAVQGRCSRSLITPGAETYELFQDVDINELCNEFTNKARCDGQKVVLEPEGVHHIIEALAARQAHSQGKQ